MGLFNLFKNNQPSNPSKTGPVLLGPAYLDGLTEPIDNAGKLKSYEWQGRLKTPTGQNRFNIEFYGQQQKNLIFGTDFAPALIFAKDPVTQQKFLLFDGCKHGYNAMFCDTYTDDQIKNRPAHQLYTDPDGNDVFEVIISAYYQFNYDDAEEDFLENVDENGNIELVDGSKIEFETAKRNGFDVLQISVINSAGKRFEMVSEELA
jgi:hypothetical protein